VSRWSSYRRVVTSQLGSYDRLLMTSSNLWAHYRKSIRPRKSLKWESSLNWHLLLIAKIKLHAAKARKKLLFGKDERNIWRLIFCESLCRLTPGFLCHFKCLFLLEFS
jgi:hypothetical protein